MDEIVKYIKIIEIQQLINKDGEVIQEVTEERYELPYNVRRTINTYLVNFMNNKQD